MTDPLDGKRLQPPDIVVEEERAFSLADAITLASSNHLRRMLGLCENDGIAAPAPRCATRKNPSLDNYLAELLLRTCHLPGHHVPAFEEHWIRGSTHELSTELNPALVGAVLIGIGGASRSPEFKAVYDEHRPGGQRSTRSTTEVVCERHLGSLGDRPGLRMLKPLVEEVSAIDAAGGATYEHLYSIAKILHVARFPQPVLLEGRLEQPWKRAILNASLTSVGTVPCTAYDNEAVLVALARELDRYVEGAAEGGGSARGGWDAGVAGRVRERLRKTSQAEVHGAVSILTLRKVYYALQRVWHPSVVSVVMSVFFESLFQAQFSFEDIQHRPLRFERLPRGQHFLYYVRRAGDILPHRGLMARMDRERKHGILAVYDPLWRSTMLMRSRSVPYDTWHQLVSLVRGADRADCWYTPTQPDGTFANFLLNRSESFVGTPATRLTPNSLLGLCHQALRP